jgi:hypothetical protein
MAFRSLVFTVASLLVAGTSAAPQAAAYGNGAYGNGTLPASGLKSCAAGMDGQLPSNVPSNFHFSENVRRYYIAAEEVEWDYAPSGWDNWLGVCGQDTYNLCNR